MKIVEADAAAKANQPAAEAGRTVVVEKVGIPIPPDQVTPQMVAGEAQRAANAAMMGAAAESIQAQTAAKTAEAAMPVDTTGLITEVPGAIPEAK